MPVTPAHWRWKQGSSIRVLGYRAPGTAGDPVSKRSKVSARAPQGDKAGLTDRWRKEVWSGNGLQNSVCRGCVGAFDLALTLTPNELEID